MHGSPILPSTLGDGNRARKIQGMSSRSLRIHEQPGLGVELDFKQLTQIAEITEPVTARAQTYFRPDGSITNW